MSAKERVQSAWSPWLWEMVGATPKRGTLEAVKASENLKKDTNHNRTIRLSGAETAMNRAERD